MKYFSAHSDFDFFIKSYLSVLLIPFASLVIWLSIFYFSGKSIWSNTAGEGGFAFAIYGTLSGFFIYLFSFLVSIIFILVSNKKLMSGSKISKKSRIGLFGLAFLFYLLTMWGVSLFM